jgi:hypothetical protein
LGAEKLIAAQKENQKIAVEIKSFLSYSVISDFHQDRVLYLAVPLDIYETFFKLEFTQLAIANYQFKLIVYDTEQGGIVQWIS